MSKLILNAEQRDAVRSLVRKAPGFKEWRANNGAFASRDFTADLLNRAIADLGLYADVMAALGGPISDGLETARATSYEFNVAEDEKVETMIADAGESNPADDMADSVLSPLRPFLSPSLLDTVAKALEPIVAAAIKPPVEIERVVTVDGKGAPVVAPAPSFKPGKRVGASTIAKLFGTNPRVKHSDKVMSQWDCSSDVPPVDPFFVPDVFTLSRLISAIDPALPRKPRNIWLAGPAGTGKSTMPEQVAARAGRSFVDITFQKALEFADVIGGDGFDGKTYWRDGMLTRAIRRPGTIILLDEITLAPPGVAAMLQGLLASRRMTLPTGEVVHCADGVTFVCADNTRGYGDESGLYAGTHQANGALVDRMARMIVVDYLSPDLESQALANHTLAPRPACDRVVAFVGLARKLSGFETIPLSLRRQVAFVEMSLDGYTTDEAFEDCFLSRLPDAERATLKTAFKADFDGAAFHAELNRQPLPAKPSNAPEQKAAQSVFTSIE